MTRTHQKDECRTPDLVEHLRTMAAMLRLGEGVSLASEVGLLESAATEIKRQRNLVDRLRTEAQTHSGEARTANSSLHEAYQAASGSRGEPGNWNGANPIKDEIERLRTKLAEAEELANRSLRRLVELSKPGSLGAFAARDAAVARAVLAEAQLSHLEMANLYNDKRARTAEKRLADARAVIEPFANRYDEIMQTASGRRVAATYVDAAHLRAAAKWMEKNQ
jgi:hypothetical protein